MDLGETLNVWQPVPLSSIQIKLSLHLWEYMNGQNRRWLKGQYTALQRNVFKKSEIFFCSAVFNDMARVHIGGYPVKQTKIFCSLHVKNCKDFYIIRTRQGKFMEWNSISFHPIARVTHQNMGKFHSFILFFFVRLTCNAPFLFSWTNM